MGSTQLVFFLKEYGWYTLPTSVHKIFFHAWQVADYFQSKFSIPLWMLFEEAGETSNKEVKKARQFHSRKISRLTTITDMAHMRYAGSDPMYRCERSHKVWQEKIHLGRGRRPSKRHFGDAGMRNKWLNFAQISLSLSCKMYRHIS
eukprot:Pompholyxophrys_punicea_v1_NODE_925_length_1134_cov_1.885079.p2 type:complete len:146 gc:universal NODE_925_length_1134_cov_1.885079:451-888(+)